MLPNAGLESGEYKAVTPYQLIYNTVLYPIKYAGKSTTIDRMIAVGPQPQPPTRPSQSGVRELQINAHNPHTKTNSVSQAAALVTESREKYIMVADNYGLFDW